MPVKWYGPEVKQWINENYDKRVGLAGEVLKKEMKRVLSKPGRTLTVKTTKSGKTRRIFGKRGSAPSAPGEPPAKQTGGLFRSVFKKVLRRKNQVRVGAKGRALNVGVPSIHLEARPYLAVALAGVESQITQILSSPLPEKKIGDG